MDSVINTSTGMNESRKILAGMSHEIRTYMNSIVSYSFLIEEKSWQNSAGSRYGNVIFNTCTQVLSLMENYFQSAMIDCENPEVKFKRCSPAGLINDLIPVFTEILQQDRSKRIRLIIENCSTSSTIIYLDKDKVSKSIQNFFRNSVNNMDRGYIKVGSIVEENDVKFYILDSQQDHAKPSEFLNTNDLDDTLTKYFDAITAVNTLLSKKLINLIGGTIKIVQNENQGTGVYISLPVKVAKQGDAAEKKDISHSAMWRRLVSFII